MKHKSLLYSLLFAATSLVMVSCEDDDGINDYIPERPVGGYLSSSEIAPDNLVAFWSFNNTLNDSVANLAGTNNGTTFTTGRKREALKGAEGAFVSYETPGELANLQSFTVSLWINTEKHTGGAQTIFMLPKTSDEWWGNFFLFIEGNDKPTDSMQVKLGLDGSWIDLGGDLRLPNMYGGWRHLAFSYNGETSKFSAYLNGSKVNLPDNVTNVKDGNDPKGPLSFTDVSKLIIGGHQRHLGAPWPALEPWMLTYTGLLDEFRVYDIALPDMDINALYKLESMGR